MKPIDLSLFSEHSQRIPVSFLETKLEADSTLKKREVFASHALDGFVILQTFLWFKTILEISVGNYMMTNMLEDAYSSTGGFFLNSALIIFIGYSYFCASYYFNQGQTPGMKMLKKRISMDELSLDSALRWTAYSLSIYATFGLTVNSLHTKFKDEGHGSFSTQDHHYQQLMCYKTWAAPDLVVAIEKYEVSESVQKAA
jgi:hypothetical protein